MFGKLYLMLFLTSTFVYENNGIDSSKMFKVPIPVEIREKNRPVRLVDNQEDPQLMKLKKMQDQFFKTIQKSPIGTNYKSFDQIYSFLLSKNGSYVGHLLFEGAKIALWRKDYRVIFEEFLDDFKYRVDSSFADDMVNYADFIKNMDITSIPMALELIFKKDNLGNSLAQMPMGQLVDMVQDEASRYGVDLRKVINGVLGKDSATFREFISELGGKATEYLSNDGQESENDLKNVNDPAKDVLKLFKPGLSHLLKENNIGLDAEAIINMTSYFVNQGLKSTTAKGSASDKSTGKAPGKDLTQMWSLAAPLISQLLPMVSGKVDKIGSKKKQDPLIGMASELLKGLSKSKSDGGMADINNILNLVSQFTNQKGSNKNQNNLLNAAMTLMNKLGGSKKESKSSQDAISNLMVGALQNLMMNGISDNQYKNGEKEKSGDNSGSGPDMLNILSNLMKEDPEGLYDLASDFLGFDIKSESQSKKSKSRESNAFKETEPKNRNEYESQNENVINDAEKHVESSKSSKNRASDEKLVQEFSKLLRLLENKNYAQHIKRSILDLKKQFPLYIKDIKTYTQTILSTSGINNDQISNLFDHGQEYWPFIVQGLKNKKTRDSMLLRGVDDATELLSIVLNNKKLDTYINMGSERLKSGLESYGISGVNLDNFPDILAPLISIFPVVRETKIDVKFVLKRAQKFIFEYKGIIMSQMKHLRSLSSRELRDFVADSLERDLSDGAGDVARLSDVAPECLPYAVCERVQRAGRKRVGKATVIRLGSLIYGISSFDHSLRLPVLVDVVRASLLPVDCQEHFPTHCRNIVTENFSHAEDKHEEL